MSAAAQDKVIRIGGASAFLMDSALAVPQLLRGGELHYLIFDYLAEGSMGLLGRMQAADPKGGYGTDFLNVHVGPHLREIARQGIKVVANAGGLNPRGLAAATEAMIRDAGLSLQVACVDGDDVRSQVGALRAGGCRDMFTGAALADQKIISANAYLGAFPIAAALARGADIVITGRVVDSALALGPLIHEFGWPAHDYERLAAGTLAGHLLECGAQVTGVGKHRLPHRGMPCGRQPRHQQARRQRRLSLDRHRRRAAALRSERPRRLHRDGRTV
jgi:hypothetical protein